MHELCSSMPWNMCQCTVNAPSATSLADAAGPVHLCNTSFSTGSSGSNDSGSSSGGSSSSVRSGGTQDAAALVSFGRRPVLFGSSGRALTDAQGRSLLAGPLGTYFTTTDRCGGRDSTRGWGLRQLQPASAATTSSSDRSFSSSSIHTAGGEWCTAMGDCHAIISITSISNSSAPNIGDLKDDVELTPDAAGHPLTCWDVVPMAGLSNGRPLQLTLPHKGRPLYDAAGQTSTSTTSSSSCEVPAGPPPCKWTLWQRLDAGLLWCQLLLVGCPHLLTVAAALKSGSTTMTKHLGMCARWCGAAASRCSWRVVCACTVAQQPPGNRRRLSPVRSWVVAGAGLALTAGVALVFIHSPSICDEWGAAELELLAQLVRGSGAEGPPGISICTGAQVEGQSWRSEVFDLQVGLAAAVALALAMCLARLLPALGRCSRALTGLGLLLLCAAVASVSASSTWLVSTACGAAAGPPRQHRPNAQVHVPADFAHWTGAVKAYLLQPSGVLSWEPFAAVPATLFGFAMGCIMSLLLVRTFGRQHAAKA